MTNLAVVIVSWNTRDLLNRCIETVHASLVDSGIDYQVVVVDNASIDGTSAMLRASHLEVLLLEAGRNLGFAGGNNLALRKVSGIRYQVSAISGRNPTPDTQHPTPDYVLLLNPDTEVIGDALPHLVHYLEAHADVAVVGPQLRYPDNSIQSSRRRFPVPAMFFWESTPLETRWPNNPWAQRYRYADTPNDVEQEVDWLVGAALLVRRTAIERAGLLDAGFVMYSEELEWQQRIGRPTADHRPPTIETSTPHRIVYLPSAVIIHHEGKSSEQALARRYLDFYASRLRYAHMSYGRLFARLLHLFLLVAYSIELATEATKWALGHKRPLRAQRIGVYLQVVRRLHIPTI